MAISTGKTRCIMCGKGKATIKCEGCLQEFCYILLIITIIEYQDLILIEIEIDRF